MDIGIDLGTTYSVIAVNGSVTLNPEYGNGIYIKECDVTIIPSPYGEQSFPSVAIEDPDNPGQLLFGTDALSVADEEHAPIMFSKRKMGSDEILTTGTIQLTAKGCAAAFLSFLKKCAEKALGEVVESAVVAHPAYFDRIAVEQTREAAILAGFKMELVDQMLMEPVAAALAYTRTDKRDPLNIITYDLGGGTFDITVLQRKFGIIDMKAFDGDHLLGGYNFDRELVDWVRKQLETRGRIINLDMSTDAGRAAVANLLRSAEKVKIELANTADVDKMIEFRARNVIRDIQGKDVPINERISRKDFQKMIEPFLFRTIESCKSALNKAGIKPEDIHEVLLVGGSSYGPWVIEAIKPLFPQITPKLFSPDLCVGIGAAIHGNIILPKRIAVNEYVVHLDVPEKSSIETISINGVITCQKADKLKEAITILKNQSGNQIDKTTLDPDNKFYFSNIELMNLDGVNDFVLEVQGKNQNSILTHSFSVKHELKGSDTSTITTVLPKPLFIETYDGLVPIAKEGATLPARISKSFQRLNDNPNFELSLYQNEEIIGIIRVENIPREGGKGALVDLELDITQKNEIKGKAVIRNADGSFKTERVISINYNIVLVPETVQLNNDISKLKEKLRLIQNETEAGRKNAIAQENIVQANNLLKEAERLLTQIPLERQEVYALFKRVTALLDPPRDDMRPTRKEFLDLLNRCRKTCRDLIESTKSISSEDNAGKGLDKSMVESANNSVQKAEEYLKKLDGIETAANEAASKKDRRNWLINNDKLNRIVSDIRKDEKLQTPPTIYNILLAKKEIITMMRQFFDASAKIEREGKIGDWHQELRNIYLVLTEALLEINAVDDKLSAEVGLDALRSIFHNKIVKQKIEERIHQIGAVVRTIGK